jgi:hypothetical protein
MKRYRILNFDFDARANSLELDIQPTWDDAVKSSWEAAKASIREGLLREFGVAFGEDKIANFVALGPKPLSVLAFHNRFAQEVRTSFVVGGYYPALTAASSLGERILNHLILLLRDEYRGTPEYKTVYRKESFDNWEIPISTLEAWGVLLPEAAGAFRELSAVRNRAIHFHPDTDLNAKDMALEAIRILDRAITAQFSMMGLQPWFIPNTPGESFIKLEWEAHPFIKHVYLPNCLRVGPDHRITQMIPVVTVIDRDDYEEEAVSDEEFMRCRAASSKIRAQEA